MSEDKNASGKITCVSDYIKKINELINCKDEEKTLFLYRGEPKGYSMPCCPNIFRKGFLQKNEFYEKSLFNMMRQNRLTNSTSYLENAIDAQHGEFPSRLLDVSYNCLDALYFAVTPYYHQNADDLDGEDGVVYVFYINEVFSPSAKNTNDNYDAIINKNQKWFNNRIFSKNHKFIDHTKINNRIIAQQGAFILFQGNDAEEIPRYMFSELIIDKESKKLIRRELSLLFGINTGAIYPEIVNLAKDLSQKSSFLITEEFNRKNEIGYVLGNLNKELQYYTDQLVSYQGELDDGVYFETVQNVEKQINSYRLGLIQFMNDDTETDPSEVSAMRDLIIKQYDGMIKTFSTNIRNLCHIEITDDLYIEG